MFAGFVHPTFDFPHKPILAILVPSLLYNTLLRLSPPPCCCFLCSLWALRQIDDPRLAPQQARADSVQWVPGLEASLKQAGIETLLNICLACVCRNQTPRISSKDVADKVNALKGMVASCHWTHNAVIPSLEPADTLNLSVEARDRSPRTEWHPDSMQQYTRHPVHRHPIETPPTNGSAASCGRAGDSSGRRTGRVGRDRVAGKVAKNGKFSAQGSGYYGSKRGRGRGAQHPNDAVDSGTRQSTPGNGNKRRRRSSDARFVEEGNVARNAMNSPSPVHIPSRPVGDQIKREDQGTTRVDTVVTPQHDHLHWTKHDYKYVE